MLYTSESCGFQGEEYKLFWPEQPEFVRMASRFGATIIPFGVVGEDDICHVSAAVASDTLSQLKNMSSWMMVSYSVYHLSCC
jgi:hypothetical protein